MPKAGIFTFLFVLALIVDYVLAVVFATVPVVIKQPQEVINVALNFAQSPIDLLPSAWEQVPFKIAQPLLLLGIIFVMLRASGSSQKGYKAAHHVGVHGTSRWATIKEAFDLSYFAKKMPSKQLVADIEASFNIQKEVDEEYKKILNGEAEVDQEIVTSIKDNLSRLKRFEMSRVKKIEDAAERIKPERRDEFLKYELQLSEKKMLTVNKGDESYSYNLQDLSEEEMISYIPFSMDYYTELQKKKFKELYPQSGTIFGIKDSSPVIQTFDSELGNRNVIVVGGSGGKKTQGFVMGNVMFQTQSSVVVTDPKGEVFVNTARIKEKQGYQVIVMNFLDMWSSNCWNPLDYVRKETDASTVAHAIVSSKNDMSQSNVWINAQLALLKALILYAVYEFEPQDRNLGGILNFLREFEDTFNKEEEQSALDAMFGRLSFNHPAREQYELGYKKSIGKTRAGIIISLLTTVSDFASNAVRRLTNSSDFLLGNIGRKKVALYLIIDEDDKSFASLVSLFIRQLFRELKMVARETQKKELYVPVQFVLDEFVNISKLPDFTTFLSTCRGYGISVVPILQNITQIEKIYPKETDSFLANCSAKLLLKASDKATQELFSNLLGSTTVEAVSKSKNTSNTGSSSSESTSVVKRPLLDPTEVKSLPKDEALLVTDNTNPIRLNKAYQYKYFLDENKVALTEKYKTDLQDYELSTDADAQALFDEKVKQYEELQIASMEQRKKELEEEKEQQRIKAEEEKKMEQQKKNREIVNEAIVHFQNQQVAAATEKQQAVATLEKPSEDEVPKITNSQKDILNKIKQNINS